MGEKKRILRGIKAFPTFVHVLMQLNYSLLNLLTAATVAVYAVEWKHSHLPLSLSFFYSFYPSLLISFPFPSFLPSFLLFCSILLSFFPSFLIFFFFFCYRTLFNIEKWFFLPPPRFKRNSRVFQIGGSTSYWFMVHFSLLYFCFSLFCHNISVSRALSDMFHSDEFLLH